MRIRSISVDGFKGLPDKEFGFVDARTGSGARLVAITGPPASGKTSLLDAIIAAKEDVGPYGAAPDPARLLRTGTDVAKVSVEWELSAPERERFGIESAVVPSESIFGDGAFTAPAHDGALSAILSDYAPEPEYGTMEYFHAHRQLTYGTPLDISSPPGGRMDRLTRLTYDGQKYGGLVRYIVEAGLGLETDPTTGQPKKPGRVKAAFETLCSSKRLGGLYRSGDSVLPGFFDAQNNACGLSQLTDSEKDALLFATTFVRAGIVGNLAGSIILIDRPEMHLSEDDAGVFLSALMDLGEQNQFIIATRSKALTQLAQQTIRLGS